MNHIQKKRDPLTELQKKTLERIKNMWRWLNIDYDGDEYYDSELKYPGEVVKINYNLWIIYDKNNYISRCSTGKKIPELWDNEKYYIVYQCIDMIQAKKIKQIIKNVLSDAGYYKNCGKTLPF